MAVNKIHSKYVALFDGEILVIQEANYIEHGWQVKIIHDEIVLWEIPYGGGDPIRVNRFNTIAGAIIAAEELT